MLKLLLGVLFMSVTFSSSADDVSDILDVLSSYAEATEKRDISLADNILHDKFRVLVIASGVLTEIDKVAYLSALEAKKIGGQRRVLNVQSIDIFGSVAQVRLVLSSDKMDFIDRLHIQKSDNSWKIVNNLTEIR